MSKRVLTKRWFEETGQPDPAGCHLWYVRREIRGTFVGDRGMIKSCQIRGLAELGAKRAWLAAVVTERFSEQGYALGVGTMQQCDRQSEDLQTGYLW